eukprot:GHVT01015730.1.p1 GENE.GHVT01015730.1~~GHVT01015730.1.p1  ORF type:complete len:112 (+),score=0.31 GHVT01015730.1:285-620(+)
MGSIPLNSGLLLLWLIAFVNRLVAPPTARQGLSAPRELSTGHQPNLRRMLSTKLWQSMNQSKSIMNISVPGCVDGAAKALAFGLQIVRDFLEFYWRSCTRALAVKSNPAAY